MPSFPAMIVQGSGTHDAAMHQHSPSWQHIPGWVVVVVLLLVIVVVGVKVVVVLGAANAGTTMSGTYVSSDQVNSPDRSNQLGNRSMTDVTERPSGTLSHPVHAW